MKRVLDIGLSCVILVMSLPLLLLLGIAIRLETAGNPIFVQQRVGRGQQAFAMYKLRTMYVGTASVASHEVGAAHVTRVGRILRKLKLDELPQLWNVVNGSMSLVGPRPCLFSQHELISARQARGLFAFRPGITGPAQLANLDMSRPVQLSEVEAEYFPRATWLDDMRILAGTFLGGGGGDPAQSQNRREARNAPRD